MGPDNPRTEPLAAGCYFCRAEQERAPSSYREWSSSAGGHMTEDEVEAVAAELAKAGGLSWHSGKEYGPVKLVMERYRDRARLAIAALERIRAGQHNIAPAPDAGEPLNASAKADSEAVHGDTVAAGSLVLYRPPGDQRTYACRVELVEGSRAYLIPELPTCTGWVDLANVSHSVVQ